MHELSLALEIRAICERELAKRSGVKLKGIGVQVGAFSGVQVEALEFCLEVVLAERHDGVSCRVEAEPGVAACPGCGHEFRVERAPFECPECGALARGVSGGQSLVVSYLEVE
jgi:hydrogenase nickel incorporation protein HypA/HybF